MSEIVDRDRCRRLHHRQPGRSDAYLLPASMMVCAVASKSGVRGALFLDLSLLLSVGVGTGGIGAALRIVIRYAPRVVIRGNRSSATGMDDDPVRMKLVQHEFRVGATGEAEPLVNIVVVEAHIPGAYRTCETVDALAQLPMSIVDELGERLRDHLVGVGVVGGVDLDDAAVAIDDI